MAWHVGPMIVELVWYTSIQSMYPTCDGPDSSSDSDSVTDSSSVCLFRLDGILIPDSWTVVDVLLSISCASAFSYSLSDSVADAMDIRIEVSTGKTNRCCTCTICTSPFDSFLRLKEWIEPFSFRFYVLILGHKFNVKQIIRTCF